MIWWGVAGYGLVVLGVFIGFRIRDTSDNVVDDIIGSLSSPLLIALGLLLYPTRWIPKIRRTNVVWRIKNESTGREYRYQVHWVVMGRHNAIAYYSRKNMK